MNILFLSTSDSAGGAAIACLRLVEALREQGHQARLLVMEKRRTESWIQAASDVWPKWREMKKHLNYFVQQRFITTPGYQFTGIFQSSLHVAQHAWVKEADVLCLHWINHGFLGEKALSSLFSLKKPIVWHMHDYWSFTGGCHYPGKCTEFMRACQGCMALKQPFKHFAAKQLQDRKHAFEKQQPTLVGASQWLTNEAAASALGGVAKVVHIPNPLDPNFKPMEKSVCRTTLQLNQNKRYLLFAAMNISDVRKGFHLLKEALHGLDSEKVGCLVVGKFTEDQWTPLPLEVRALGPLNQTGMMQAYNAADVFVIPSLEENLPNTILESLACGTPVAGFSIGGIPEMVEVGINGFLSRELSVEGLLAAIQSTLEMTENDAQTSARCIRSIERFHPTVVAGHYARLFLDVVANN